MTTTKVRRGDMRIELLRVVGALSVFVYHFMGDVETVLNPALAAHPAWDALRSGSGPFGVSLFVIVSGIVFGWAWPRSANAAAFIKRRLLSLFSLYWWISVPLIAIAVVVGRMPLNDLWKVPIWLAGLGVVSPRTFFPVVDGWWYMTLALQLVIAYPLTRRVQDALGNAGFLAGAAVATVLFQVALQSLGWRYAVAGFVGTRLFEFAVGMTIGRSVVVGERSWPPGTLSAMMLLIMGVGSALHMVSVASLAAAILVVLVLGVVRISQVRLATGLAIAGQLSFAFFLSHSPWAKPILSALDSMVPTQWAVVIGAFASLAAALCIAWFAKWSFDLVRGHLKGRLSRPYPHLVV